MTQTRKSVADMISVFSSDTSDQPHPRPHPHSQTRDQSNNDMKRKDTTKDKQVTIFTSNTVDESDPRYQRTLKHFSSIGKENSKTTTSSYNKQVIVPERNPGGVYYRRRSLMSDTSSPKTSSLPNSPSQGNIGIKSKPVPGTGGQSATVKRSLSFTSRVSVDVTPSTTNNESTMERKRSSIVFSVNGSNDDEEDPIEDNPTTKPLPPKPLPPKPLPKPITRRRTLQNDSTNPARLSVKDRVKIFSNSDPMPPTHVDSSTAKSSIPNKDKAMITDTVTTVSSNYDGKSSGHSLDHTPKPLALCKVESPLFVPKETGNRIMQHSLSASSVQARIQLFNQPIVGITTTNQEAFTTDSSSTSDDDSSDDTSAHSHDDTSAHSHDDISVHSHDDVSAHSHDDVSAHSHDDVSAHSSISSSTKMNPSAHNNEDVFDDICSVNSQSICMDVSDKVSSSMDSSSPYSYYEYTLQRKKSRATSASSGAISTNHTITDSPGNHTLEIIHENDSSVNHHSLSSIQAAISKQQFIHSSDESEQELVRKMSSVSLTFYQEVLETISKTIGPPTENEEQTENINKVVNEIIRGSSKPSAVRDDENIYETIEEYSRKVSDYVIRHRNRERRKSQFNGDSPPQLPPRPPFLLKLSEEKEISILSDDEEPFDELIDDTVSHSSPMKKRSSSSGRRHGSLKITPERNVLGYDDLPERRHTMAGSKLGIKKKKKKRPPFFKSKIEPKEYNDDVALLSKKSSKSASVSDHRNTIQPTNTSESENDTVPVKQHPFFSSSNMMIDDQPTVTPDSGVFPELLNSNITSRYVRNPQTPPLVTKLGVRGSSRNKAGVIRFSNSDPSLHTTLLLHSVRNTSIIVPDSSSMSHISVESDLSELTPSISSFESWRYASDHLMKSPMMRKRVKSDVSSDRPANSSGSIQKNYLLNVALRRRRSSLPGRSIDSDSNIIEVPLVHADCIMDRPTTEPDELSFTVNDVIAVLDMTDNDWWQGMVDDRVGWFPASWVRLRIGQENNGSVDTLNDEDSVFSSQQRVPKDTVTTPPTNEECIADDSLDSAQYNKRKLSRRMTITKRSVSDFPHKKLSSIEIRGKCIEEILTTEKEYVQHLEDIVEGFLKPCEQHSKLFTPEIIEAVFSNIKEIYEFQQYFLRQLLDHIDTNKLDESQIGQVFVRMGDQFCIYSEYCNNHPNAVNEMKSLKEDPQYTYFFESCRLLRNLTDISLEGFLLTPVQRICRYPLQLTELLKHTPDDHPDHNHVLNAFDVMKKVAMVINERKRRMENISSISKWQETVDNWKGHDVLERSSVMIHSGELHKISKGHSQERHFFLFDHQLIYCKKDAIGGKLTYKGRLDINKCTVFDVNDGEITHNGSGVKNAWKMTNADKDDKMYILYAKSPMIKQQWMEAFTRERHLVREDNEKGFVLSPKMKRTALSLALSTTPRRKSISKKAHVIIDTSANGSSVVDVVGVAQLKPDRNKGVSSPNEFRKRFISGKKK